LDGRARVAARQARRDLARAAAAIVRGRRSRGRPRARVLRRAGADSRFAFGCRDPRSPQADDRGEMIGAAVLAAWLAAGPADPATTGSVEFRWDAPTEHCPTEAEVLA